MQRTSSGPVLCFVAALSSAVACNRTPEPTPTAERPAEKAEPAKAVETSAPAQEAAPANATPEAVGTASATPSATAAPVASSALDLPPSSASKITDVPTGHKKVLAKPVASVVPSTDDPLHGVFTLESAIAGLPGKGVLTAEIKTDLGKLDCELYADKAPITVANFRGSGSRPTRLQEPEG